jgi:hypothetical protein
LINLLLFPELVLWASKAKSKGFLCFSFELWSLTPKRHSWSWKSLSSQHLSSSLCLIRFFAVRP